MPILVKAVYILVFGACCLHFLKVRIVPMLLLIIAAFLASYWAIGLDNFLNDWDERYHALVAKNLSKDMLHPKLYKEHFVPYDYDSWIWNYTWLHKQPLFLWLMAISIKLFGIAEKSIRLPSAIMVTILPLLIYRIGYLLNGRTVGFLSALLAGFHFCYLQNASGPFPVEHNNIHFLFFITLSFMFWIEYEFSLKNEWLYAMGFAAGCAILVKWLVGLLVFAPFGFYHLFITRDLFNKDTLVPGIKSFLVCLLVFLPWQLYCYIRFPKEFLFEMAYNSKHLKEAVEGHSGEWDFYITILPVLFLKIYWLIAPALLMMALIKKNSALNKMLLLTIAIVYVFFSWAATKMDQYVIIASPFILYGIALLFVTVGGKLKAVFSALPKVIYPAFGVTICMILFHLNFSYAHIMTWNMRSASHPEHKIALYKTYLKTYFKELENIYDPNKSVIIFCDRYNIETMFYSNFIVYTGLDKYRLDILKKTNKKILVFNSYNLPQEVRTDTAYTILDNIPFE